MVLRDLHGRALRNLRLSVTDRCNLRCSYCMPASEYSWLPRADLLCFEETSRLVDVFVLAGVEKLRLTGGEPLLRRDLPRLVAMLAAKPGIAEIALTTNGLLLEDQAEALYQAGLTRLTVSLDTLDRKRFEELTRRDELERVLRGIAAAARAGRPGLKLDAVVLRGRNDDELGRLLAYARELGAELRFIEYMDVGGAREWSSAEVVTRAEMLERIAAELGPIEPLPREDSAPAERFRLGDGTHFGIIASTSAPFCGSCDRSRLTADGVWYLCLYALLGIDLRGPLRAGESEEELLDRIRRGWTGRSDRGAEQRLALRERAALFGESELARDPHLEMHTRGG